MRSIIYLGCPAPQRAETEKALAARSLSIVCADSAASAVGELPRRDIPVSRPLVRSGGPAQRA